MNSWLLIFTALLMIAAFIWVVDRILRNKKQEASERFEDIFRQGGAPGVRRFDSNRLAKKLSGFSVSDDDELSRLLVQAGWDSSNARYFYSAAVHLGPVITGLGAFFLGLSTGTVFLNSLFYGFLGFAFFYVAIRTLLRRRAASRRKAISKEVVPFLHLLRMLFDAGLTLEHAIRIIVEQSSEIIPNLAQDLRKVLARINSGQDHSDALANMAAMLEVDELSDAIAMIRQVTRHGGNIRESLITYTELVEERQFMGLREYVSKLSAKMTVVMMLFMFPSLMICIAGPGMMGLGKALGQGL